jgi:uncharacterized membrane protein
VTATVAVTLTVELTPLELLDISVAAAFLAERGVEASRPRFAALAMKAMLTVVNSDVDMDELRVAAATPAPQSRDIK